MSPEPFVGEIHLDAVAVTVVWGTPCSIRFKFQVSSFDSVSYFRGKFVRKTTRSRTEIMPTNFPP